MKKLISKIELRENKLESFLNSNNEFEFQKLNNAGSLFSTYNVEKEVKGEKRRLSVIVLNIRNMKDEYHFCTVNDYKKLIKNLDSPLKGMGKKNKVLGKYLKSRELFQWLKDPNNDSIWFSENIKF